MISWRKLTHNALQHFVIFDVVISTLWTGQQDLTHCSICILYVYIFFLLLLDCLLRDLFANVMFDGFSYIVKQCEEKQTRNEVDKHESLQNRGAGGTGWNRYFLARDSIYAIARSLPSPVRLSVCLSGRLSVCPSHGWISQRRFQLGSCNLHHRVAPWF